MRQNTIEYRRWKEKQNKRKLKYRTRRRRSIKESRRGGESPPSNRIIRYESNQKIEPIRLKAPSKFCIVENPEETIGFFKQFFEIMKGDKKRKKQIYVDLQDVTYLQIDALMYLLAIMDGCLQNNRNIVLIGGNRPKDKEISKRLDESGFYNYVDQVRKRKIEKSTDKIQILTGKNCDTNVAKTISDFVSKIAGIPHIKCGFLYNTVVELMQNTYKHAYNDNENYLDSRWYYFVEHVNDNKISFTFMDTGSGIPKTVSKKLREKLGDLFKPKAENLYVISALNGEFRSETKESNRGKGLPRIRWYRAHGNISELFIVSNKAKIEVLQDDYRGSDLTDALQGTLYYWSVDLDSLKGD